MKKFLHPKIKKKEKKNAATPVVLAVAARCRPAPPSTSRTAPRESPLCGLEIVYDDGAEAMDNALIGMVGEGIDELLEVVAHEAV